MINCFGHDKATDTFVTAAYENGQANGMIGYFEHYSVDRLIQKALLFACEQIFYTWRILKSTDVRSILFYVTLKKFFFSDGVYFALDSYRLLST